MYKITCDNLPLYIPDTEFLLTAADLNTEVNKAGTLTLGLASSHPHLHVPKLRTSIITVTEHDKVIFKGTPLSPKRNLYGEVELTVVGELSFFNDSIQLPFEQVTESVEEAFKKAVNYHNTQVDKTKRFKIGNVTVTNDTLSGLITRSSEKAMSTWEFLQDKFLKPLGGYLLLRHVNGETIIDYLAGSSTIGDQTVEQCINLLDIDETIEADDVASIIVPYGSKIKDEEGNETKERITVETVNNGSIFVTNQELLKIYGPITKTKIWENVTLPENLLKKAEEELASMLAINKIELTAADLSRAGYSVHGFRLGSGVRVSVKNLNINETMMIKKLKINLLEPSESELELGRTSKTMSDFMADSDKVLQDTVLETESLKEQSQTSADKIIQQRIETTKKIEETVDTIMRTVKKEYLTETETKDLIHSLESSLKQGPEGFEMLFNQLKGEIDQANGEISVLNEQKKFIKFINGEIIVGAEGNPLTAVHTNHSLEFRYNGRTVGMFTNEGLETRNVTIENRVNIGGKWIFTPGSNNGLDLKWIGG